MTGAVLTVTELSVRFGGLLANNEISMLLPAQSISAIVGPNGAGKIAPPITKAKVGSHWPKTSSQP